MPESNQDIELRSDEVQEIMSHVPHWMIRWGITLIFGVILMLIFISWFIKYPDVVQGKVTVSTAQAPITLVAVGSGELENLHVKDGQSVSQNELIATIGNSFSEEAKDYLSKLCIQIKEDLIINGNKVFIDQTTIQFGSLQSSYSELITALDEYQALIFHDQTAFKIETLQSQIRNHNSLKSVSNQQLNTALKELEIVRRKHESDQRLYEKKVISGVELYDSERQLIQIETNIGNYKKAVVQTAIALDNLKNDLNDLKHQQEQQKVLLLQKLNLSLATINNAVEQWGQNFQFKAPINGVLAYQDRLSEHQFIESGTNLFTVIPSNQKYIGYLDISKSGSGKVKIGQKVRVQIDKYPHQEYGQLNGKVLSISLLPNKEVYRVTFELTNGMKSSYGKMLKYSPEMSGTADIITEDERLISRVFNNFKSLFD